MFRTSWIFAAIFLVVCAVSATPSAAQDCGYDWVSPLTPQSDLFRIFERSGLYIAVGAAGTIVTSHDGLSWQVQRSGTWADLHGVDYGNGYFVVVGDGVVLSSRDAIDWTIVATPQSLILVDVDYGVGRFVAVGDDPLGRVLISENGLSWVLHDTGWSSIGKSIVWTGEKFLVSGQEDIFTSVDGLTWDNVGTVPRMGRALTGKTGLADSLEELDRVDLAWDGNQFIWVGGREIFTSEMGDQWEYRATLQGCEYFTTVFGVYAYGGKIFVTGASACPDPFINPDAVILVSTDGGAHFVPKFEQRGGGFTSVTKGVRGFVAVGSRGDFVTSNNGLSWTCTDGSCASEACFDALFDIAVAPAGMVAVGGVGHCDVQGLGLRKSRYENTERLEGGTILRSSDGKTWTPLEVDTKTLLAVARNPSIYVAVGSDVTATSRDGIVWDERAVEGPPVILKSVAWGNETFVSVGTGGTILASSDGINWAKQYSFTENDLKRVSWDGNNFYVVGAKGTFLWSYDGRNWTVPITVNDKDLHGIVSTGSSVYVVGDGGGLWSSEDFETWIPQFAGTYGNLNDITWNGEYFVAVGYREMADGSRPAVVTMSADGVHWSLRDSQGAELNRVVNSGDEFFATGYIRSLIRSGCPGILVTIDPPRTEVLWSESVELTLTLSETAVTEVGIELVSSMPGAARVPESVRIAPGSHQTTIEVEGLAVADGVLITATLPEGFSDAVAIAEISVVPPLPDPRQPQGRRRTP